MDKNSLILPGNPGASPYSVAILAGAVISIFASIYWLFVYRQPIYVLQGLGSIAAVYLVGRAVIKRMPSKMEVYEDSVFIYDVPSFRIELDRFYFPLLCKKSVSVKRDQLLLEWVDSNLTWNDLEKGRSVFLVSKEDSSPAISWLKAQGFSVPPEPE